MFCRSTTDFSSGVLLKMMLGMPRFKRDDCYLLVETSLEGGTGKERHKKEGRRFTMQVESKSILFNKFQSSTKSSWLHLLKEEKYYNTNTKLVFIDLALPSKGRKVL